MDIPALFETNSKQHCVKFTTFYHFHLHDHFENGIFID